MDTIDRPQNATHEVTNQPPPLANYNVAARDAALLEGLRREGAGWDEDGLRTLGELAGSYEAIAHGFAANKFVPELQSHDRYGHRIDDVAFHPSWHWLMEIAVGSGLHGAPWREPREGAHAARAARFFTWSQVESGHGCPISMTYASIPVVRRRPDLAALLEPVLTSTTYEPGLRPLREKRGALCGMAMTEKQGGSDVRANTTRAEPFDGDTYALTGHKWFCSAPMSDAFLVLAQAPDGLTCFFMNRVLPDGIVVAEMFAAVGRINAEGTTILLVEQNVRQALEIATRGYVIETGRVVGRGTRDELLASDEIKKAYLGL